MFASVSKKIEIWCRRPNFTQIVCECVANFSHVKSCLACAGCAACGVYFDTQGVCHLYREQQVVMSCSHVRSMSDLLLALHSQDFPHVDFSLIHEGDDYHSCTPEKGCEPRESDESVDMRIKEFVQVSALAHMHSCMARQQVPVTFAQRTRAVNRGKVMTWLWM